MPTELEEVSHFPRYTSKQSITIPHQLVEFLHHGNTQIRQVGACFHPPSSQTSPSKRALQLTYPSSRRTPRRLLSNPHHPLQTLPTRTNQRPKTPNKRLHAHRQKRAHNPNKHIARCRSAQVLGNRRRVSGKRVGQDNSMLVPRVGVPHTRQEEKK